MPDTKFTKPESLTPEQMKAALDDIADSVQCHFTGKAAMMDLIEDTLKKLGYTFV